MYRFIAESPAVPEGIRIEIDTDTDRTITVEQALDSFDKAIDFANARDNKPLIEQVMATVRGEMARQRQIDALPPTEKLALANRTVPR